MPNWNVEAQALWLAIGSDVLRGRRFAVDDHLDRHVARGDPQRSFEMPVRLLIESAFPNGFRFRCRLEICQKRRDVKGDFDRTRLIETQPADSAVGPRFTNGHVVHAKVENMTESVATITAAVFQPLDPVVIGERLVGAKLDVDAPEADLVAVDAGERG